VPRPSPITFNDPTPLDLLLKATLEAAVSSAEATARLYGPVYEQSDPISIHIGTSTHNGRAAFSLWRGVDSPRSCSYVLDGKATEPRACVMAVLCAARDCPQNKSLVIYTCSEYVIRSFCYWAGNNETRGWSCANGEEFCDAVGWIARRRAPINFRWVSAKQPNA
ncbi:hypothetical protein B0H13DRAFT_1551308, partial [Mycena leptocephala]